MHHFSQPRKPRSRLLDARLSGQFLIDYIDFTPAGFPLGQGCLLSLYFPVDF